MDRRAGGGRGCWGARRNGAPARAEDITRAVLSALADWQAAQRPPEVWWKRAFKFLSEHWPILTVLATILTAAGAMYLYGFSPFYPFKALAFSEKELAHREREFTEQQGAFERAAQERELKARLAGDSVRLAKSFLDVGQIEEAKRAYKKALELDTLHLEARHGLFKTEVYGMAAAGQHDPEVISSIRKRLESLLAIDAKDPHALSMLGNLYARAGLGREEAIAKYRQAIAIDPAVAQAHFGLATLYLKDDELEQAQALIEEAVRLSPWNPRYLETLAYVRDRSGNAGEALELYQRAINLAASTSRLTSRSRPSSAGRATSKVRSRPRSWTMRRSVPYPRTRRRSTSRSRNERCTSAGLRKSGVMPTGPSPHHRLPLTATGGRS
jgi:tetratricopeptide (TPR) repeat protein